MVSCEISEAFGESLTPETGERILMAQNKDDEEGITCPACKAAGHEEALGAQGLVLAAAKALLTKDDIGIMQVAQVAGPYDFHMAITFYVELLLTLSEIFGVDPLTVLSDQRSNLDEAIARS